MEHKFINKDDNPRLILIFAGWATDASLFNNLRRPGYDIMVVWDYADMTIDWRCVASYREICVVAWSLGVYASAVTLAPIAARVTLKVAINGTLHPVDASRGIPPAIFHGTLDGLNERNLSKFYRRVAGSRQAYEAFAQAMPEHRPIERLKAELEAFLPNDIFTPVLDSRFDRAVICHNDAIFPATAQWNAWKDTPRTMIEGSHLPDFQAILDRFVLDKDRTSCRFAAEADSYDEHASVQSDLVDAMRKVMEDNGIPAHICRRGSRTIEIGSGTGKLTRILHDYAGRFGTLEMWDLANEAPIAGPHRLFRRTDAETELMRTPSNSTDLIASASTVQWFNSPSRFLCDCARVLVPGGILLVGTYARGNLAEMEAATGVGLPLLEPEDWLELAPKNLEPVIHFSYRQELTFDSPTEVFRHLRATGVNSLGRNTSATPMRTALRRYPRSLDGMYRLTYRPFIFMMRKK